MRVPQILDMDEIDYMSAFQGDNYKTVGERSALQTICEINPRTGQLWRKIERAGFGEQEREDMYTYRYDYDGRLLEVESNHLPAEKYTYNDWGQRFCREAWPGGVCEYFIYKMDDTLREAGRANFEFDGKGRAAARVEDGERTEYSYRNGVLLERVTLPSGEVIDYAYGKGGGGVLPVGKLRNGKLVVEYAWQAGTTAPARVPFLLACRDYEQGLEFHFKYENRICPESVIIKKISPTGDEIWKKLCARTGTALAAWSTQRSIDALFSSNTLELRCGCDQVGTLKRLSDYSNYEIKHLRFDSFGNVLHDTLPELRLPLGFAAGLWDHDTGLVRFGCRDYDPLLGRFLCPDPLGDMGDGYSPYGYCVDDPVNCHDPNGLWTRATFDEAKVARDDDGKFSSAGNAANSYSISSVVSEYKEKHNRINKENDKNHKFDDELYQNKQKNTRELNHARAVDRIRGVGTGAIAISRLIPNAGDIVVKIMGSEKYNESFRAYDEREKKYKDEMIKKYQNLK